MTSSKACCGAPGLVFIGEEMQRGSAELLDKFGRRGDGGGRGGSRRRAANDAFREEIRGGRDSHGRKSELGRGPRWASTEFFRVADAVRDVKSMAAQISTVLEV